MPFVLRPPGTRPLPERLADLGRARRASRVASGLFTLLAVLIAGLVLEGLIDAAFGLPALVRGGFLVGILLIAGIGWLRFVRPAVRESVHPQAVALRLESAFPKLNDALASAVDFLAVAGPDRMSRFQKVAALRAENLTERLDLRRSVPVRRAWGGFWLLVLAAGLALAFGVLSPTRATAALLRLGDPFGNHPWPTRTVITLIEAPTLLALGDPYPLRFQISGALPELATVSVRPVAGPASDEVVSVPEDGAVNRPLDPGRVGRDFEVRVAAGDGDTGWTKVEVAPPPKLVPFGDRPSPLVRLTFPAYTDLTATDLPDGTGVVEGVAGTVVHFRAMADRDIRSAAFVPQFDLTPYHAAEAVAALACDNPLSVIMASRMAPLFAAPVSVSCHGPELSVEFIPPSPGLYALRFTDARGLTGTRLVDFRMFSDPAPAVTLDRPNANRDPLDLLPSASLRFDAAAEDRPFAVRWLAVEYRVGTDGPFRQLSLARADAASVSPPALGGGLVALSKFRPPLVTSSRFLQVAAFTRPDGTPPADGDTVTIRAAAADWDDRTTLKAPGRSGEVELRVASRDALEARFQKELAGLRPDLLRAREELRAAREKLTEPAGASTAEVAVRRVKAKVDDPAAGLKTQTERLEAAKRANGLSSSPTTDKVEAAAESTRRTAELLDEAEAKITAAKQSDHKSATEVAQSATAAAEAEVNKLLERLEQWGGAGEVRGEARSLIDQVKKAGEQAEAAADQNALLRAADKLDRAGDQAAGLIGKAGRLAVEKAAQAAADRAAAETAPPVQADVLKARAERTAAEAEALRRAVRAAGGEALPNDLHKAADELRKNRPGESTEARRSAAARLDKLSDPLAESRSDTRSESAAAADKLATAQDELRKKTKQAQSTPDPEQRAEQLRTLAREQQRLKVEAERLAERLTREKNEPAATAMKQAAEQLADASEQLEQGQSPEKQQSEGEKKLEEVKAQLDTGGKKPGEQLSREKRAELSERLKSHRDRQKAAVDEASRVVAAAAAAGQWNRPLIASLGDLEEREAGLAAEVRPLAEKDLAETPVFAKLAAQAADGMTLAGKRVAGRRDDVALSDALDPAADERVLAPMRTALRKLDQIIAAIAPDPTDKPKPAPTPIDEGGGGGQPPGEGDGRAGGGIPPLAQLKALRAMQAEVAEQTADFAKAHPDPQKLTPDEREELAVIEQTQRDVAELFAKLAAAFATGEQP